MEIEDRVMTQGVDEGRIPKSVHAERADRDLATLPGTAGLSPLEKLAIAARILAAEGHAGSLAGQITARATTTGQFLTLALGIGFDEVCATDVIRIDDSLNVVEGEGVPNPATRFHLWIYRHRPHIQAIIHTHAPAVSALSMLGAPLVVAHMDTTMFQDDCAFLPEWPGLPIGDEEGRIIADHLRDKRSIMLANHGLITTGTSIEEATYLAVALERGAALQLAASAAGKIKPVDPAKAREAGEFLLKTPIVNATFAYLGRRAQRGRADAIGRLTAAKVSDRDSTAK
jgi:L-fuculose-phosphate aldolase